MRLIAPPLEIPEDDPFKPDVFNNRREFAESLTNLLLHTTDPLVVSLDAEWGQGKTTFVKMWVKSLKEKDGIECMYIDAFASDYTEDPFIAIASEINTWLESTSSNDCEKSAFLDNAARVGKNLLKAGAVFGLKALSGGMVGQEEVEAVKNAVKDGKDDPLSLYIAERIKSHAQEIDAIESFKKTLSAVATHGDRKRLLIIVDELDRCKPTYAVRLLEVIKHFFAEDGVAFVLVMNKGQLEESIKSVYGAGVNAAEYLQKFISFEVRLPWQVSSQSSDYTKYANATLNSHQIYDATTSNNLVALFEHFKLTLRQMEKAVSYLVVYHSSIVDGKKYNWEDIVCLLAVLKVKDGALFASLRDGKIDYNEFIETTGLPIADGELNSNGTTLGRLKDISAKVRECLDPNAPWLDNGKRDPRLSTVIQRHAIRFDLIALR